MSSNNIRLSLGAEGRRREIRLIGTAHISRESIEEVTAAIREDRPGMVCVELDEGRYAAITQQDAWKNLNVSKILREGKGFLLIANIALASFQRRLGNEIGVKPGEEMLAAINAAKELGIEFSLCDREVQTTLRRAWASCGLWSKCKLLSALLVSAFAGEKLSADEIESLKKSNELDNMMKELAGYLPAVKETLIDERDRYLAAKIWAAAGKPAAANGACETGADGAASEGYAAEASAGGTAGESGTAGASAGGAASASGTAEASAGGAASESGAAEASAGSAAGESGEAEASAGSAASEGGAAEASAGGAADASGAAKASKCNAANEGGAAGASEGSAASKGGAAGEGGAAEASKGSTAGASDAAEASADGAANEGGTAGASAGGAASEGDAADGSVAGASGAAEASAGGAAGASGAANGAGAVGTIAVVGAGHLQGIQAWLEKFANEECAASSGAASSDGASSPARNPSDSLAELEAIPPKSLLSKCAKWIVPALILGLIGLGFWRADASHALDMVMRWVLVNSAAAALGAILALAHPLAVLAAALVSPVTVFFGPFLSPGLVAGLAQAALRKPRVSDAEAISADIASLRGFYRNRITKALLVFILATLGGFLGTWIAAGTIAFFPVR